MQKPTGSMKDRMAVAVISRAEADGRLRPGDTASNIPEVAPEPPSPWSALAKGYPIHLVSSKAFSQEKLDQYGRLRRPPYPGSAGRNARRTRFHKKLSST